MDLQSRDSKIYYSSLSFIYLHAVLFLRKFAAPNNNELSPMKLYLFNPDSDLALADNGANYIAPASARRMAQDLALLPMWYAAPDSAVLAPSAYNADFLKRMRELFPLRVRLATEPELPDYAGAEIVPWGWNPSVRSYLLKGGIDERGLPALPLLAEYRRLSSRLQAVAMARRVTGLYPEYTCGEHYLAETPEDCERAVDAMHACLLKMPWSGSGKGLNWCLHGFTEPVSRWCARILKEQGCLTIEPIYNKVKDFALEFYADGRGEVLFAGYSLFSTNGHGAYAGNLLASDEWIEENIARYLPLEQLALVREALRTELAAVYGAVYTGYIGVDMMICRQESGREYVLHPCVEINMRLNMGVVARLFHDNFVAPGATGRFEIEYHPDNGALRARHEQDLRDAPPLIEGGRLVSGYLPLVPVTPKSLYRTYARVHP